MELTVLGSSGTWPNADTATSGYLVQHDGFNLWMDAGTGTLANMQQHIDIPDLDAIVISHEHPDHFVDLSGLLRVALRRARGAGPAGLRPDRLLAAARGPRLDRLAGRDAQLVRLHRGRARGGVRGGAFPGQDRAHGAPRAPGARLPDLERRRRARVHGRHGAHPSRERARARRGRPARRSHLAGSGRPPAVPHVVSTGRRPRPRVGGGQADLTHIWPSLDHGVSRQQAAEEYRGPIDTAVEGMRLRIGW